ncbi:permease [Niallia sp. 03133]|uniref:permease n=1 Tax=Niallia sp. 03133 TaxID=3458060 RepID=UPI004044E84B
MFAGHFGLAAIVKAKNPDIPLWTLMAGSQLLDIAFVPLLLTGSESIETVGDGGYGAGIFSIDYSHSFVSSIIISLIVGLIASRFLGKKQAFVIGSVVFSHWILDVIVHRPDLSILPGNLGRLPQIGFGLWQWPVASMLLELLIVVIGGMMYYRSMKKDINKQSKKLGLFTSGLVSVLLILALISDFMAR